MIILDTIPVVVNNIIPGKSNFEIYAPYIAVFISIIAMFINYFLTTKQIKENNRNINLQIDNSQKLLEKTIQSNKEQLRREKEVETKLKLIDELVLTKDIIVKNMNALHKDVTCYGKVEQEFNNAKSKLYEIILRLDVNDEIGNEIVKKTNTEFLNKIIEMGTKMKNKEDYTKEYDESLQHIGEFIHLIIKITEEEIKKINDYLIT